MATVTVTIRSGDTKAISLLKALASQHSGHSIGQGLAQRQVLTNRNVNYVYSFPNDEKAKDFKKAVPKVLPSFRAKFR